MAYTVTVVSDIATGLEIARSEWKRQVDEAVMYYRMWRRTNANSSNSEWLMHSGKLGVGRVAAGHAWDTNGQPTYAVTKIQSRVSKRDQYSLAPDARPVKSTSSRRMPDKRRGAPYEQSMERYRDKVRE